MIKIPSEAMFDLLQTNKAQFRYDYKEYEIKVGDINKIEEPDYDNPDIEPVYYITMKKGDIIFLLIRGVFSHEDFNLLLL